MQAPTAPSHYCVSPDAFAAHVDGELVGDSRPFGWRNLRAEAYRYTPKPDSVHIPGVDDHLVVELKTSNHLIDLEWKRQRWQTRPFPRGAMLFYPEGEDTVWRWQDSADTVMFLFPRARWRTAAAEIFGERAEGAELVPAFRPEDPGLERILLLLADELYAGAPNGSLYAESLADAAIARLLQRHSNLVAPRAVSSSSFAQRRVQKAIDYIEANLANPIGVDDLAEAAGLGAYTFPRAFRAAMGQSPYQYLLYRRVEHAADLVAGSNLTLAEIALSAGFSSQSHFTTAFRKARGITPAAYRRQA